MKRKSSTLSKEAIADLLEDDDLGGESDISGMSDNSDLDETYQPDRNERRKKIVPSDSDSDSEISECDYIPVTIPSKKKKSGKVRPSGDSLESGEGYCNYSEPSTSHSEPVILMGGISSEDEFELTLDELQGSVEGQKEDHIIIEGSATTEKVAWNWKKVDIPTTTPPTNVFIPKNLPNCHMDVHYFLHLFGDENFTLIATETNRIRGEKEIEKNRRFNPITECEIKQVFGMLMYMSVVHLPSTRLYWSAALRVNAVSDVMSRDRFQFILSCLHLSNNAVQPERGEPEFDILFKVREFLDNLNRNFESHADPEQIMSVDEQMIPFKGRHSLKVYMKNKPSKWGIKAWGLAGQTGYVRKFNICGDRILETSRVPERGIGASGQTVIDLVTDLPPGTNLCFDNYFASPPLLLYLKSQHISATCTLRSNRLEKCPLKSEKDLRKEGRGSLDYFTSDEGILVAKWFDNKEVTVGSNKYGINPTLQVKRWDKKIRPM